MENNHEIEDFREILKKEFQEKGYSFRALGLPRWIIKVGSKISVELHNLQRYFYTFSTFSNEDVCKDLSIEYELPETYVIE